MTQPSLDVDPRTLCKQLNRWHFNFESWRRLDVILAFGDAPPPLEPKATVVACEKNSGQLAVTTDGAQS